MIGRWGGEVRADFFERGLDLDDWLATPRRWPALLEILDRFDSNTWLGEAVERDTAEERVLAEESKGEKKDTKAPKFAPPRRRWSLEALQMAELVNEVQKLRITFISANIEKGKKAPRFEAFPTPVDPKDEFRKKKKFEGTKRLLGRVGL